MLDLPQPTFKLLQPPLMIDRRRPPHAGQRVASLTDEVEARGAAFVYPRGGRVDIRTAEDWATVTARAGDEDEAPVVTLHAALEDLDARGRTLGEAFVSVRHNNDDLAVLGGEGTRGRAGAGYLAIAEGDQRRITLGMSAGQAEVALRSPTGDDVVIDAGPDGTGVTITGPGRQATRWLDTNGLRGPQ